MKILKHSAFIKKTPHTLMRECRQNEASENGFVFPVVHGVIVLPQADYSIWVPLDLVRYWKESTAQKNAVHLFPKEFEEKNGEISAFLHYVLSSPLDFHRLPSAGVTGQVEKSTLSAHQILVPADLRTGFPRALIKLLCRRTSALGSVVWEGMTVQNFLIG